MNVSMSILNRVMRAIMLLIMARIIIMLTMPLKRMMIAGGAGARAAGRCVLTRISEGRLPPGLANWPADVEVESTDFIEL